MTLRRPSELRATEVPLHRPFGEYAAIEPLLQLCKRGKLYEVETWIADGRPLQFPPASDVKLRRRPTALQVAIERGFHSLAALLLANGYNPNGDYYECLSPAVRAKDRDMVDLLLRFGVDPKSVDFCEVLETCDRELMDRFVAAGVDPCHQNALARAITSMRRPILGFIKQHRDRFPAMQDQIDIALHRLASRGSIRGVALMLWLGANPHSDKTSAVLAEDYDTVVGDTAFETAMWNDKPQLLTMMMKRPIPKAKVDHLLLLAAHRYQPELVERLLAEGANPNHVTESRYPVLYSFINGLLWRYGCRNEEDRRRGLKAIEYVLKAGAIWSPDERQIRSLRRDLAGGESALVVPMLDLLHHHRAMSEEHLRELTRTPAVQRVLNGYTKPLRPLFEAFVSRPVPSPTVSPRRGGYWKRHWSQR